MSKAAELAALIGSQTALSNRNLIINGAMTVNQRGDSTSKTATGYYGPDRFQWIISNLGTWSISQSTTVPSGKGFGYSYKLEATTADASPAAGDFAILSQKIEGQNLQLLKKGTSDAESVTLSFWARSSKTGTFVIELYDTDNTRSISKSSSISSIDTWEYKTITFAGDTTGAFTNDANESLQVNWWLGAGSTYSSGTLNTSWGSRTNADIAAGVANLADTANATFYITGVQLEVGDTATPFEHESYDTTIQKCYRYYYKTNLDIGTNSPYIIGSYALGVGATLIWCITDYPVPMRIRPTALEQSGTASDYGVLRVGVSTAVTCSAVPTYTGGTNLKRGISQFTASGVTNGAAGLPMNNTTNGYLAWSAEL